MNLNIFEKIGISEMAVTQRIEQVFETLFFDPVEKIYFEKGADMGYMLDTGNNDARSEGMSYGMMMAVQMNRKDLFDRLWLFSKTYMYQTSGIYEGYFAWSVTPEGVKNAQGPAPDGEEYFALALFFAAHRWGNGEWPYNYTEQAKTILRHCVHQKELVPGGAPMWNPDNHYIKFVPDVEYSDPSYHLPHFYELFAKWGDPEDHTFWQTAAKESRKYLELSSHEVTGMTPEYANYDGTPKLLFKPFEFYSDAYRVAMNIGLDAAWCGKTQSLSDVVLKLQSYLEKHTKLGEYDAYFIDGRPFGEPAMHPNALIATTAAGTVALSGEQGLKWVEDFWEMPLRKGDRRYYDNCLHFFCLLLLSGNYRIYEKVIT